MKKFLLMTAALAATISPAMAANWQGKTYGHDAVGWYQLNASVQTFCRFGTANTGGATTNATVTPGAPGSAGEADGTFNLNIQDPNDDTIRFAEARYDIDYAVCNTPFGMTVNSAKGGLETTASTSDNAFLSLVPYKVQFRFDGVGGTVDATQGTTLVDSSTEARAGSAHVTVRVPARDKLLLEGTYSDFLIASLVPNMGN